VAELRVWALSDGRPGHYNQARGIVAALQRVRPVSVHWIDVRLRVGLARALLRRRLNRAPRPTGLTMLRAACRLGALPAGGCDLIVSAGGRTSFANAWLAGVLGVPNVFAGSLRGLHAGLFKAVLTLEPLPGAPACNLVLDVPPSALTPEGLRAGARRLREALGDDQRLWALMLGGDGAGYRFRQDDWRQLAQALSRLSARHGVRWLLLGSRRTGGAAQRILQAHLDPSVIARSCWFGGAVPCDTEAFLGAAERVLVTEDSMTMLSEAIASRRPVYSLRPAAAAPDDRYRQAVERFAARGLICRRGIEDLVRDPEALEATACHVLEHAPLVALGERLSAHLGLQVAS
jgi:uncharacterized protein